MFLICWSLSQVCGGRLRGSKVKTTNQRLPTERIFQPQVPVLRSRKP